MTTRTQATLKDILGHEIQECIFSPRGNHPFKYDPCRNCKPEYYIRCGNYLSVNGHQQTQIQLRTPMTAKVDVSSDKPADGKYVPMIIRSNWYQMSKTQKVLDWIRRANDSGVI